ncbi:hypothetical protein LF935_21080 [Pectobacterium carotovorum]|uniref:hypothetical protein n=1 Tax=Pectobacterium carotovorum TaxID=554 RepID=UPI001CF27BFE|nr:hypothetical protein [Pectobacterium carotovorum]MCA6972136.1 hypothetical protein [Pectobacterium carotovorum]MCQ8231105.1 hypothetical protein [Pectobacterium carotovorum]
MTSISFTCGKKQISVPSEDVAFYFPSIIENGAFFVTMKDGKQYRATSLRENTTDHRGVRSGITR